MRLQRSPRSASGAYGRDVWADRTCLRALNSRARLVVTFAVLAGLRPGEILGLQWRH
jgi:integrase